MYAWSFQGRHFRHLGLNRMNWKTEESYPCAQIPSFWTKQKVSKIIKETKSAKTNWTFVHRSSMAEKANHEYCMCEKKKPNKWILSRENICILNNVRKEQKHAVGYVENILRGLRHCRWRPVACISLWEAWIQYTWLHLSSHSRYWSYGLLILYHTFNVNISWKQFLRWITYFLDPPAEHFIFPLFPLVDTCFSSSYSLSKIFSKFDKKKTTRLNLFIS